MLSGFELYPRWVPLYTFLQQGIAWLPKCQINQSNLLIIYQSQTLLVHSVEVRLLTNFNEAECLRDLRMIDYY